MPSYGDKVAFFAVYDGHGGSEVAEYCSMKLPDFLKNLESYKQGNYEQALKDAFIGFDATLLQDTVVEELRQMARKNPDYEESDMDMEDEETAEEIIDLHQEASMSLSEVLEKYKGKKEGTTKIQTVHRMIHMQSHTKISHKDSAAVGPSSSSSIAPGPSGSSATPDNEVSSSSSGKPSDGENEAPSSSQQPSSNDQAPDSTLSIPADTQPTEPDQSKPSVSSEVTEAAGSSNGEVTNEAISSSQENGEISTAATSSTTPGSSSSSSSQVVAAGGSSSSASVARIPNHISSSDGNADDTDSLSTDDEHDETYKESPGKKLPHNSDSDTTAEEDEDDEDMDEEELSNEEISGEEDEDDELDDDFMNNMETGPGKASGCTAVVALLVGRQLYVANAGDSRCVVCRGGKVVEMSFDHKPEDDIEFQRIRKAGGRVTLDGRVNGGLNLSRAIGDHGYKMNKELSADEQMISALPDLKCLTLEPEDEFMVLACDGIWNYMTNEEVVGFVKARLEQGKLTLSQICEELFHNCLAPDTMGDGTGCDNMTAIIVKFKPTLFELPTPATSEVSNSVEIPPLRKRVHEENDPAEAEALVEPSDKRQKIEDDLPAAVVDTSTTQIFKVKRTNAFDLMNF